MDDDLRSRYRVPRRDYSQPIRRPYQPQHRPAQPPKPNHVPETEASFFPIHQHVQERPAPPPATHHRYEPTPAAHHQSRTKQSKRRWPKLALALLIILALAGSGGGIYYYKFAKATTPLPKSVTNQVKFNLYYPSSLPANYQYQTGSATIQYNFLAFKLTSGPKLILVTEQAKPTTKLDLNSLASFKSIDSAIGSAVIGSSLGNPAGIILTPTTLVNLSGVKSVSQDDIASVLQAMQPLKSTAKLF